MSAIVVRPKLQAWARIAAYRWRTRSGFRVRAPPACRKNCVNPVQESTSIRTSASSTLGRPFGNEVVQLNDLVGQLLH